MATFFLSDAVININIKLFFESIYFFEFTSAFTELSLVQLKASFKIQHLQLVHLHT